MDILMGHMGHGIWLILLLSMPAVLLAAGIGLVVGILQAVTQVQEQTISAAPKLVFVFLLVIFGGPFIVETLKDFMLESVHLGMEVIPRSETMVLPPKPRLAYGEENSRMEFFKEPQHLGGPGKIKEMMGQPTKLNEMSEQVKQGQQVHVSEPTAKPGVGEKIYLKRRAEGTLPKPPDKRTP